MVVIRYYLKEIDPHGLLLPEEIKDAQFELEMFLESIAAQVADWPAKYVEVDCEESKTEMETPGGQLRVLPSFAVFRLKLRGEKDTFEEVLKKKLDAIK